MTDSKAVLAQYRACPCDSHTCGRCMKNAAQLRAWNIEPVEESQPAGEPDMTDTPADQKPRKRKTKSKGGSA